MIVVACPKDNNNNNEKPSQQEILPTSTSQTNESLSSSSSSLISEINNLIDLKKLNLNHILDVLEKRYLDDKYYTEASLTLIALNPFKNVDYLYSKNVIEFYNKYYLNSNNYNKFDDIEKTIFDLNLITSNISLTEQNLKEKLLLNNFNLQSETTINDDNLTKLLRIPPMPHIFKYASIAWKNLIDYFNNDYNINNNNNNNNNNHNNNQIETTISTYQTNQTIIVSGVSGSGKTRAISYIMYYFTHILNTNRAKSIENVLLLANVILESFGNAKTLHNDNSSRFGKYIQLNFKNNQLLYNVKINTYLLEKTRVLNEIPNERNFHIFYQIISGCSTEQQKRQWGINDELIKKLLQTNNNNLNENTINDSIKWQLLQNAFNQLKIRNYDQIYKIIIAIAHLNCCSFISENYQNRSFNNDSTTNKRSTRLRTYDDIDNVNVILNPKTRIHLEYAAKLLGFKEKDLENCLLVQDLIISQDNKRKTTISKKCNLNECKFRKDCLAKLIYSDMFLWLVNKINENLNKILIDNKMHHDNTNSPHNHTTSPIIMNHKLVITNNKTEQQQQQQQNKTCKKYQHAYIGLLDLYGFENNEIDNSLEQLCINYANERLHQIYIECFLKFTQYDYLIENIKWNKINFNDNINLINTLDLGTNCLFNILNEECRLKRNHNLTSIINTTQRESQSSSALTYTSCSSYKLSTKIINRLRNNNYIKYVNNFNTKRYSNTQQQQQQQKQKDTNNSSSYTELFLIKHYAGDVCYNIDYNLIEKNKDQIPNDLIIFLSKTDNNFLIELLTLNTINQTQNRKQHTVLKKFKQNLDELIDLIKQTQVNYIKCIKPNELFNPSLFDRLYVLNQLESCGIVATVNLYKTGYTNKVHYHDFLNKYLPILVIKKFKHLKNNDDNELDDDDDDDDDDFDIQEFRKKLAKSTSLLLLLTRSINKNYLLNNFRTNSNSYNLNTNNEYLNMCISETNNDLTDNDATLNINSNYSFDDMLSYISNENQSLLNDDLNSSNDEQEATTPSSIITTPMTSTINNKKENINLREFLNEMRIISEKIVKKCLKKKNNNNKAINDDLYQFGKMKIFFKDKLAQLLDLNLNMIRNEAVYRINSLWKSYKCKKTFKFNNSLKNKLLSTTTTTQHTTATLLPKKTSSLLLLLLLNQDYKPFITIRKSNSCPTLLIQIKNEYDDDDDDDDEEETINETSKITINEEILIEKSNEFIEKKEENAHHLNTNSDDSEISLTRFCLSSKCDLNDSDIQILHATNNLTIISKRDVKKDDVVLLSDCL